MAYPTYVNNQITDAVTQSNVTTLAESAAIATSNLYQAASSALANAVQNATFGQQQGNMVHQAATAQGVNLLYAVDTEAVADAAEKVSRADVPADVINSLFIPGILKS